MEQAISIRCSRCHGILAPDNDAPGSNTRWVCERCGFAFLGQPSYIDLIGGTKDNIADHYSAQWSEELGFPEFVKRDPRAKGVFASAELGWDEMFSEIRQAANSDQIYVYDAACGFGGIAGELIKPQTVDNLVYVGADVHRSLPAVLERVDGLARCGLLLRWDITDPLPVEETFDYVLCRAALHHTPVPSQTFASLCASLKPGGKIAISVYRKKSVCREASDEALRALISRLPVEEAFDVCRQFTNFGKALQAVKERVTIGEDLPLLGIRAGEYGVQELIYYHFLKCFHNELYGDKFSTVVNFDWYHPAFAHRYEMHEVRAWFEHNGIEIVDAVSSGVQHYLVGTKRR